MIYEEGGADALRCRVHLASAHFKKRGFESSR